MEINDNINHTPAEFAFKNRIESEEAAEVAKSLLPEVYRRIQIVLDTYMVMEKDDRDLVALWIIGTYLHKEFTAFPRLFINAMKGSGKSRLLKILEVLCWNGSIQTSLKEAVLFRTAFRNTLLFDESESMQNKDKGELRELLNAGYKKGGKVRRMKKIKSKEGEEMIVDEFDLYGPVALANINGLEDVLEDRCISVILEKSNDEIKTKLLEDFDKNPIILDIKRTLELILVYKCSVVTLINTINKYNPYTLSTLHTLHTHTTQITPQDNNTTDLFSLTPMTLPNEDSVDNEITESEKALFDSILSLGISGRSLELFFPFFIIAKSISEDLLQEVFTLAVRYTDIKTKEDMFENRDWSLIEFISKQPQTLQYRPVSEIVKEFRDFYSEDDFEFITSRWLGKALKRLKLHIDRRRVGKGAEYILDVAKAKDKLKRFKGVEDDKTT